MRGDPLRRRDRGLIAVSFGFLVALLRTHLSNASGSTCYDSFDHFVEVCSVFGK
jgi:hypothetical protein